MTSRHSNIPWTIPVADGPVSVRADRTLAVAVAGVAGFLFVKLWGVQVDPRGHGTHEAFGMDPCGWPLAYGVPCPACGCTTASAQVVQGDLLGAVVTQPFGAAVAMIGLAAGVHAVFCLVRGRSFVDIMVRLPFWQILMGLLLLFFAAWGYKYMVW
ncbi:MAG: DUF2752 domain-containing protein [Planctomycetota bacterium]